MKASFGQNLQESETDGKCGASESTEGFPLWLRGKEFACSEGDAGDMGSIPGSGRSPGGGNPLQYSCLENSMDRGTWWARVHGVAKNQTQLGTHALDSESLNLL